MELSNIILKPYHSEKSHNLRKSYEKSTLTFIVDKRATKNNVAMAFEKIYGVKAEKINIVNRKAQAIRTGTLKPGRSKHLKIAYIILPKGMNVAITKEEMEEAAKAQSKNEPKKEKVAKKAE